MKSFDLESLKAMSNFEVAALFLEHSKDNELKRKPINVGRGNPNWVNATARIALSRVIEFGLEESAKTIKEADGEMVGFPVQEGIAKRFEAFLKDSTADKFLKKALDYVTKELKLDADSVIFEFANGAIGNHYPVPSRSLVNVEKILNKYLEVSLYNGEKLADKTHLFPTEGGAASMVYLFNELKLSRILKEGDKIAMNTPIFTPYLEMPELSEYELTEVKLDSFEDGNWQMNDEEFDKLKDPSIKAFFVVNPTNPTSRAFSQHALDKINEVVEANPEIVIITDDVYGTFVDDFQTIYSVVPHNTLLVYSFSKLYGATGSRVGVTAVHEDNIFDKIIAKRTKEDPKVKAEFEKRYSTVVTEPLKMKFIDRMVADSRSVALYHVAGLSTPMQVQMTLFALTSLIYAGQKDPYIEASKKVVKERYDLFWKSIGIDSVDESKENAVYYSVFSLYKLAAKKFSPEFSKYLETKYHYLEIEAMLATKYGVVVMDGAGMGTQPGYIRISFANAILEDYAEAGKRIAEMLEDLNKEFTKKK